MHTSSFHKYHHYCSYVDNKHCLLRSDRGLLGRQTESLHAAFKCFRVTDGQPCRSHKPQLLHWRTVCVITNVRVSLTWQERRKKGNCACCDNVRARMVYNASSMSLISADSLSESEHVFLLSAVIYISGKYHQGSQKRSKQLILLAAWPQWNLYLSPRLTKFCISTNVNKKSNLSSWTRAVSQINNKRTNTGILRCSMMHK